MGILHVVPATVTLPTSTVSIATALASLQSSMWQFMSCKRLTDLFSFLVLNVHCTGRRISDSELVCVWSGRAGGWSGGDELCGLDRGYIVASRLIRRSFDRRSAHAHA